MGDPVSTRRRARAAQLAGRTTGASWVPGELLDPRHGTWRTDLAAAAWHDRHGLPRPAPVSGLYWPARYRAAVAAWATVEGILDHRGRPDLAQLARLGIVVRGLNGLCRIGFDHEGDVVEVVPREASPAPARAPRTPRR